MVERHHELSRQTSYRVEDQVKDEGIEVPSDVSVAETMFAKNALLTIGRETPYRAVMGRDHIILQDFEPISETQLDDMSAGIPGTSRHHMRVRDISVQSIVQQTAIQRLERALNSKARLPIEQLDLQPGDLVDFWRKPATKDESGWRGPAKVAEAGTPLTVKWQNRHLNVAVKDVSADRFVT